MPFELTQDSNFKENKLSYNNNTPPIVINKNDFIKWQN